jgi:hypothetical protein
VRGVQRVRTLLVLPVRAPGAMDDGADAGRVAHQVAAEGNRLLHEPAPDGRTVR